MHSDLSQAEDAHPEAEEVRRRYDRRPTVDWRYSMLNPAELMPTQERERLISRMIREQGWHDMSRIKVADVGCGGGGNLLMLLRFGFSPENLTGIELLAERHARAKAALPSAACMLEGDASVAKVAEESQDLVMQHLVFSNLFEHSFQEALAASMWRWTKPGGVVLWHDLAFDNPRNPDIHGLPLKRVRQLFPQGGFEAHRITLAPPVSRLVTRLHPALYTLFNASYVLRTHWMIWIRKPG